MGCTEKAERCSWHIAHPGGQAGAAIVFSAHSVCLAVHGGAGRNDAEAVIFSPHAPFSASQLTQHRQYKAQTFRASLSACAWGRWGDGRFFKGRRLFSQCLYFDNDQ